MNPNITPDPSNQPQKPQLPPDLISGGAPDLNRSAVPDQKSGAKEIVNAARAENGVPASAPAVAPEAAKPAAAQHEDRDDKIAKALGGGKEGKLLAALTGADASVEAGFQKGRQTVDSAAYRGIWGGVTPKELFSFENKPSAPEVVEKREKFREIVLQHAAANTLFGADEKVTDACLRDISKEGYFGQILGSEYGGLGFNKTDFARTITRTATISPVVAGLASVHQCIGAVDPLIAYGTPEQQAKYLPALSSGEKLSAFALTEPGAGSDLNNVKTKAVLDGDHYVINGEKLFITNVTYGRVVGLVTKIDNPKTGKEEHAVFIVDIPEKDTANFQLKSYGLHPLRNVLNKGMVFNNFRVPKENLLDPTKGDPTSRTTGLAIAYHGLNAGRLALCANAAGAMRGMLANMPPWIFDRESFGQPIAKHQLVQTRLGKVAARIVLADSLRDWCADLMDKGFRGEMECIIAKIMGSEVQKEVAIEYFMKTHGGRALLKGHLFGDNIADFLAPLIYEGEGDMLKMGFMNSLLSKHIKEIILPLKMGQAKFSSSKSWGDKFDGLAAMAKAGGKLMGWTAMSAMRWVPQKAMSAVVGAVDKVKTVLNPKGTHLAAHGHFATAKLQNGWLDITKAMATHQAKLQYEQATLISLSEKFQNLLALKVVSAWGLSQKDPVLRKAAEVQCRDLRRAVTGGIESDADKRYAASLGRDIASGRCDLIKDIPQMPMLKPYDEQNREIEMAEPKIPDLSTWAAFMERKKKK